MHNREEKRNSLLALGNKYRIYILFLLMFTFMSLFAPHFFNVFNLTTILKTASLNATVALGFCIILITAQLDLSIGTIVTFAGIIGLGLKGHIGYGLSLPAAVIAGGLVGLLNGLLVTRMKIHSFIVTIGTMTILQGAIYTFTGGNSVSLATPDAFAVSDFLSRPILPLITPRVLILILLVIGFEIFLRRTQHGRNFFLVGGNKDTAWLAGINTDRYIIGAFVISGVMAAFGGVLFAMESSAATLNMGDNSLMYVITATIIGGTSMAGGKGGALQTVVAVLTLEILYTGIILLGLGNEVKIFVAGLILALVVLYEAYAIYSHERNLGQRPELLAELEKKAVEA